MIDGPIQHFRSAILDAWRLWSASKRCVGKGSGWKPHLDVLGTQPLPFFFPPERGDRILPGNILCGGVENGFLPGKSKEENVPFQFCGEGGGCETDLFSKIVHFLLLCVSGKSLGSLY